MQMRSRRGIQDDFPSYALMMTKEGIKLATDVTMAFFQDIDEQPTVDAEPIRHGKWVYTDDGDERYDSYKCSVKFLRNCYASTYSATAPILCH